MEKKSHTVKSLLLTNAKKRILYVSELYEGSVHDYHLLQDCFNAGQDWFKQKIIRLDLGFQGFKDLYRCKKVYIPHKKKRCAKGESNELNEQQKATNKEQAGQRIKIEHSIGGMKRYRILSHRLTFKSMTTINCIVGICAGLWNLFLK